MKKYVFLIFKTIPLNQQVRLIKLSNKLYVVQHIGIKNFDILAKYVDFNML